MSDRWSRGARCALVVAVPMALPAPAAELAFSAPRAVAALTPYPTHVRVLTARFDADPYADTLVWSASGSQDHLTLRRGAADGLAPSSVDIPLAGSAGPTLDAVAAGDIDGDGDADLAVIRPRAADGQPELYLMFNDGLAGFGGGTAGGLVVDGADRLRFADLDEDGRLDLVADRPGTAGLRSWRNLGGSFASPVAFSAAAAVDDLEVADVNGDGHLDLVLAHDRASGSGAPAGVMRGRGDGSFHAETLLPSVNAHVTGVALGDLDGDGDLDLGLNWWSTSATTSFDSALYRNDGGSFTPLAGTGALLRDCQEAAFGHVDADGVLDIHCGYARGAVGVRRGLGGGTFAPLVRFKVGNAEYGHHVSLADVDGDGRNDVIGGGVDGIVNLIRGTTATSNTPPPVRDLVFRVAPEQTFVFLPDIVDAEGHYVGFEHPVVIGRERGILWVPSSRFEYVAPPLPYTEFTPIPGGFRADVLRKIDDVYSFEVFDDRGGRSTFTVTFQVRGDSGGGGASDPLALALLLALAAIAMARRRARTEA